MFIEHYDEWCLYSYSCLEDMSEAEEVVQDVCVNILLRGQKTKILNLKAYIITAVKNRSFKKLKRSKKFETLGNTNILTSPSIEEGIILLEDKLYLQKAIESLPEPSKNVFLLCVLERQKYENVANTLGISVNTVKYHIKKAYKTLRTQMEDTYFSIVIVALFLSS